MTRRSAGIGTTLGQIFLAAAIFAIPAPCRFEEKGSADNALDSLIEAERAFSRTSESHGIREAFLAFLAEGAIVFRPEPVAGRPVYEKMDPANPALLVWEPEVAEVSGAGDLGYTSGPFRLKRNRSEADFSGFGRYVSVWKKQPGGSWRVVLDIGISHERPGPAPEGQIVRIEQPGGEQRRFPGTVGRGALPALPELDKDFSRQAGLWGYLTALMESATEDIRVYRQGHLPRIGRERFKEILPLVLGSMGLEVLGSGTSESDDLGYTYGTFTTSAISGDPARSSYLKIWRRVSEGDWKICLDIALPAPRGS